MEMDNQQVRLSKLIAISNGIRFFSTGDWGGSLSFASTKKGQLKKWNSSILISTGTRIDELGDARNGKKLTLGGKTVGCWSWFTCRDEYTTH